MSCPIFRERCRATGRFLKFASICLAAVHAVAAATGARVDADSAGAAGAGVVTVAKIGESMVDPSALTLGGGAKFGYGINGQAFQQDVIHTFAGRQYVAYYDGDGHVCVARRRLPDGPWRIVRLLDYQIKTDDAHNVVSLGICEKDGTIHLSFDHHDGPLHYRVSKPGAATRPENAAGSAAPGAPADAANDPAWNASLFGPVRSDLKAGEKLVITYPRFWSTPSGGLQFHYRRGASGDGDNMLCDYDPATGDWSEPRQIDSGSGTFTDEIGHSAHRNAYPNGYDYDSTGRLHATWVWRESARGNNHDLMYDYSDDYGKTWFTDAGQLITQPANIATPGLTVVNISRRQGLMNNQAQAIDSKNRIHVVMWSSRFQIPLGATGAAVWGLPADRRYRHYWRESAGKWHDDPLPWVAGSRPRIFFDDRDDLILIYNRPLAGEPMQAGIYYTKGDLVIAFATAAAGWKDWQIAAVETGPFINEMLADPTRWKSEKILSVIVQNSPTDIGQSTPLRVLDFQIK